VPPFAGPLVAQPARLSAAAAAAVVRVVRALRRLSCRFTRFMGITFRATTGQLVEVRKESMIMERRSQVWIRV
jgi:hypothetical protein